MICRYIRHSQRVDTLGWEVDVANLFFCGVSARYAHGTDAVIRPPA